MKKCLKILSFYACVPQMTIIWCMVPEIWNTTDITFLSFWTIFYPFTPLTTCQIKIKRKTTKKLPGNIIILLKCTISDNHMMYSSWDMKSNRQNFLSFWAILLIYTKNYDHILYFSWDMTNGRCKINFHFGLFSALLPH